MPVKIFCCYAHEDEVLLNKLKAHLRPLQQQGLIDFWHDRDIPAGTEIDHEMSRAFDAANIIILLISPDFMNSDYCYSVEMHRALERHKKKEATVIPVILRPVYWQIGHLGKLQALPTDAKPVMSSHWQYLDEALYDVVDGIYKAIQKRTYPDVSNTRIDLHVTHKIPTTEDFHSFLRAFITAMEQQDYGEIAATTEPGFLLHCNNAVTSSDHATWNTTHRLLRQGALQLSFPRPLEIFHGRTQCFVSGYGAASEIVHAIYTQDGSFSSVAPGGMAQLAFIDRNIGNDTFEWFWMTAILNAAC